MGCLSELGESCPRSCGEGSGDPPGMPHCQPTPINVGGRRSGSVEAPRAHSTTPSPSKEEAPPAKSIPLPTMVHVDHTLPGPMDAPPKRDPMPLLAKPEVETHKAC